MAIQIVAGQIARYTNPAPPRDSIEHYMSLKDRIQELREGVTKEDAPELDSLMTRLTRLTEQVGDYLGVEEPVLESEEDGRAPIEPIPESRVE